MWMQTPAAITCNLHFLPAGSPVDLQREKDDGKRRSLVKALAKPGSGDSPQKEKALEPVAVQGLRLVRDLSVSGQIPLLVYYHLLDFDIAP